MERLNSTQKVFDDLRRRVSALPRLRHKAMQEELSNVITIINQIERAFVTHIASDSDEDGVTGIITNTIERLSNKDNALSQVAAIQLHLKRNFAIAISDKAIIARIKSHYGDDI